MCFMVQNEPSDDEVEKTINITWVGSRSKRTQLFNNIGVNTSIKDFKSMVFLNYHGVEMDGNEDEQSWTSSHNLLLVKSGKVLTNTFKGMGMTDDGGIPYEVSFCLGLDAGMPGTSYKIRVLTLFQISF